MGKEELLKVIRSKILRLRGDTTQTDFAELLEISVATLKTWEKGTMMPNALNLFKISEACDVSVDWLLGLTDK